MIRQTYLALAVGTAVTASFGLSAADLQASNYQQSESVSLTVYRSQHQDAAIRRHAEPEAKKTELPVKAPKLAPNLQHMAINLPSEPVVEAKPDKSMLSFIDDWLGIKPVKPWQKGTLAKKEMKPGGLVPEFDVFSEKVFSYKQGSVGGNGVGGGGCGCN